MRISLDSWVGDYGSQLQVAHEIDEQETPVQALEEGVEERAWTPVQPQPVSLPRLTAVVDGVMRSDARAVITDGEKRFFGLFCSYATGAVAITQAVELIDLEVHRRLIVGSEQSGPEVLHVPAGSGLPLQYVGLSSSATTPDKLGEALVTEMRQSESRLAECLSGAGKLILADGNLTFVAGSASIVGVIKTIQRMYLNPARAGIFEQLARGQRTPAFRIQGSGKRASYDVFSCYLRLANPRRIEPAVAGLVRLEVKASLGVRKAVSMLEQAAVVVTELASRAPKDPRAPQNLIPVGGLERQLRHRLGDPQLVRRGIEKALLSRL